MINIAILGFGTVGGGVYEAIKQCGKKPLCDVNIKYILDLRKFPGHPLEDRVTTDLDKIISDKEVSIVIETLGGVDFAYKCTMAALRAGKSVVSSNKAVVDAHCEELDNTAAENGVAYFYEAAVGGGIPIIDPLKSCYAADDITRIAGILNGTTNYILTHMKSEEKTLAEALSSAQALGYAEADPHADLAGLDTARKISILAGIAFGKYISYSDIPVVEGIENVTSEDILYADKLGCVIKLLGVAEKCGDKAKITVAPFLVAKEMLFSAVHEAFNAISVTGSAVGETVFYGQGAGSLPTASAICSDIGRIIQHTARNTVRTQAGKDYLVSDEGELVTLPNGKKYRLYK